MLIIGLIGAFVLYVALYFFYEAAGPNLDTTPPILTAIHDMILAQPDSRPLAILKWGLIIFAFYVLSDALSSFVKRRRKGK